MSIKKPLIGFSLFAIFSLLVTWVIWATLQRGVEGETKSYTATFTDVLGLKVHDDVRMAGVRVGRVQSIDLVHQQVDNTMAHLAKVKFEINSDQEIFHNTKGLIRYQNLIGQRYLALNPGSGGDTSRLDEGGEIPLSLTEPSFDVSKLLGGLQPLFDVLSPEQVNTLSGTFIQALQGDQVSLSAFITQAAALATTFNDRDAILGDLIDNLSGVIEGLAGRSGQFETLLAQARTLVGGLYEQGQSLQGSTVAVANATTSLVDLVSQISPNLNAAQTSTTDALNVLIGSGAKLDQLAIDAPPLLQALARITSEGTYINLYNCTFEVSLYGLLLPRGWQPQIENVLLGNKHSEVCR
ncbi:MCE family protein [Antrihabitans stalactiti]|jgi:phospholipid/cholesterol/gamma-HCH transport system substrate-binding protein|uniref:MCE family protein n=1 Tax=Antrihabitans stalactiti TaxID=2584121 RepID=A0A848KAJ7_9NOCA|nr:MlaD family protein [Antrihabitans stalactiti]NMN95381.1 MCE family protein [Antrihabitans stalactiti]